jgi:hypothetical protein
MAGNNRNRRLNQGVRIDGIAARRHSAMLGVPNPFTDTSDDASQDEEEDNASQDAQLDDASVDGEDLETEVEILQQQYDRMRVNAPKRKRFHDYARSQIEANKALRGTW